MKQADQDQHLFSHCLCVSIFSEDQPVCYGTLFPQNGDSVNTQYALLKTLPLRSSKPKMAIISRLLRHQAPFDSQTITILCIIVIRDRMRIFSTLKNIFEKFCTWSGHRSVPVTHFDAD